MHPLLLRDLLNAPSRPAGIKAAEHEIDGALAPKKKRLVPPVR
jgi:hypothetical protein